VDVGGSPTSCAGSGRAEDWIVDPPGEDVNASAQRSSSGVCPHPASPPCVGQGGGCEEREHGA